MTISFDKLYNYLKTDEATLNKRKVMLFPTSKQAEQNIKNIFLSCLTAIPPFREKLLGALVRPITNQTAVLKAYSEIVCGENDRPDGLIVITTGKKSPTIAWTAFVETKLGQTLQDEQVKRYYDLAKKMGIDAIITISNDPTPNPITTPINFKKSIATDYFHFSWIGIQKACLTTMNESKHLSALERFMLEELVRYFENDEVKVKSYVVEKSWKEDIEQLCDCQNKKIYSEALIRVANNWFKEEADICFHIYKNTKNEIYSKLSNKSKNEHIEAIINNIENEKSLISVFKDKNKNETTLAINFHSKTGEIYTTFPIKKEDELKHIRLVSSLINKFKNYGEEHNIHITLDYGRGMIMQETVKNLQKEKEDSTVRSYSIANKTTPLKKIKISMKIKFDRISDFLSPNKFDQTVEEKTILFFTHVIPAIESL